MAEVETIRNIYSICMNYSVLKVSEGISTELVNICNERHICLIVKTFRLS